MSQQRRTIICHYCKEEGHVKRNCPKKKASDATARKSSRDPLVCYNCKEEGHVKWDCPKKKAGDARKSSRDPLVCYNCKKAGHFKRDCPHLPPRKQGVAGTSNDGKGTSTGISAVSKTPVDRFHGVELDEKRTSNGEEVEEQCSRNGAELEGKLNRSTSGAELEAKHRELHTGLQFSGLEVVADPKHGLASEQAGASVGKKAEACRGQDESVKSRVPSSAIRISRFSDKTDIGCDMECGKTDVEYSRANMECGKTDMECGNSETDRGKSDIECGNSDVECRKTDMGCGEVAGHGSACGNEYSSEQSCQVTSNDEWCEVVKRESTGRRVQKQPSQVPLLGAYSKTDGHVQKQSFPVSAREVEREWSPNGNNDGKIMSLPSFAAEKGGQGPTRPFPSLEAEKEGSNARWSDQWQSVPAGKGKNNFEKERSNASRSLRQPFEAEEEKSDARWSDKRQSVSAGKGGNSTEKEISHSPRQPLPLFEAGRYVQRQPCPSFEAGTERLDAVQRKPLPPFVDTHCHLEYVFERYEHQGSFASFKNKWNYPTNFDGCIVSFCDPAAFSSLGIWSQLLSEKDSGVWASFGIHPHNAKYYHGRDLEEKLLKCMEHEKCVAFGEIGLDYGAHSPSLPEVQRSILVHQLQLGVALGKPLVLHCRDAEEDLLRIISTHVPSEYKIHLHCFTGKLDSAFRFLEQYPNLFIGVTGSVTYEKSYNVRAIAQGVPLERLLVETDAPYNTPRNLPRAGRCRFSHPAHAYYVAKEIANLKKVELRKVLQQVRENTTKLYGI